jgi:hypothetical protein
LDDPVVEVGGANLEDLLDGVCCLSIEAMSRGIEVSDVLSITAPEIGLRIAVRGRCMSMIPVVIIGSVTERSGDLLEKYEDGVSIFGSEESIGELGSQHDEDRFID